MGRVGSLYLEESEWDALRALAEEHSTSVNYLARMAVRRLLGLPTPALFAREPAGVGATEEPRPAA